MKDQPMRDKNILDEGVKHHEPVDVMGINGKIVGVDFNAQMVQVEINVPAHMVKRYSEAECNKYPDDSHLNAISRKDGGYQNNEGDLVDNS